MSELTPEQGLAVLQALYKIIGAEISTKNPDGIRRRLDEGMHRLYRETGIVGRLPIMDEDGRQIGLLTGKVSTPTSKVVGVIENERDFIAAVDDDALREFVYTHCLQEFADFMAQDGEVMEGMHPSRVDEPGGIWLGTTLTGCQPDVTLPSLAPALVDALQATVAQLPGEVE